MLGAPCSPCCSGVCGQLPTELYVSLGVPFLPPSNTWYPTLNPAALCSGMDLTGLENIYAAGMPGAGAFTAAYASLSQGYATYEYQNTVGTIPTCDYTAYSQWSAAGKPPLSQHNSASVAREEMLFSMRLFTRLAPGMLTEAQLQSLAPDETYTVCGLAVAYVNYIQWHAWSNGAISSHVWEGYQYGATAYGQQLPLGGLSAVWPGGPNTSPDGYDRTNYIPWGYDSEGTFSLLPNGLGGTFAGGIRINGSWPSFGTLQWLAIVTA